jgi:large subunit ribosomal protein L24
VHHASGSRLLLEQIDFAGSLGSLAGPVKGEGDFVVLGHHYPYRLGMSRLGHDGSIRVRLNVDRIEEPLTIDADMSVWVERGAPRFDGSIAFMRPVRRAPDGNIIEPWRVTSRINGDSSAAVLELIELQYGPDDRAIKLRGDAKLTFGRVPQLDGFLSSPQLDLDRMLSSPDETRRRPLVVALKLGDYLSGSQRLPFPVKLGFSVGSLTLAGSMLQRVSGGLRGDGDSWDIENLELRAPGITQIRLSGRFDAKSEGVTKRVSFKGPANIDSGDARTFFAWLSDRADVQAIAPESLRLSGDVAFGSEMVGIDRLNAEIDRMIVTGRFAYFWTSNGRPARLDVTLTAPEINIDRVQVLAKAVLSNPETDRPRQGELSFKIGRAWIGGVEAKQSEISMRIEPDGLMIDQFRIADFGGAALAVKGHIDNKTGSPRGAVTLDLDARSLDGVTALVEKFFPRAAEKLRRLVARAAPVALRASLTIEPVAAAGAGTNAIAKYKVDGRAGTLLATLQGDSGIAGDALKGNLAALAAGEVNLTGSLEADDGGDLVDLVGLNRLIAVDKRPGRLTMTAKGPLDGDVIIDCMLTTGTLELSTNGTVNASDQSDPKAALMIKFVNANLWSPRPAAPGATAELLPASGTLTLTLHNGALRLSDIKGTVAGASVAGQLAIETQQQPIAFNGVLELGTVDLTAAISTGIGVRAADSSGAAAGHWHDEPFQPIMPGASGQIVVKATRAALTPDLSAAISRACSTSANRSLHCRSLVESLPVGALPAS